MSFILIFETIFIPDFHSQAGIKHYVKFYFKLFHFKIYFYNSQVIHGGQRGKITYLLKIIPESFTF